MYLSLVYMFCFLSETADFTASLALSTSTSNSKGLGTYQVFSSYFQTFVNLFPDYSIWLFLCFLSLSATILRGLLFSSYLKDKIYLVRIDFLKKAPTYLQYFQSKSYNTLSISQLAVFGDILISQDIKFTRNSI